MLARFFFSRVIPTLVAAVFSLSAWAQCGYPDSERGEAPAWLCGEPSFDGAAFLAIGDKSRMPSISLQSRLAGKAAMAGVVEQLFIDARAALLTELPEALNLNLPATDNWQRVARFKGIKVLAKSKSPTRHLYVLAGVPDEHQQALRALARKELIKENSALLKKSLEAAQWQRLKAGQ